MKAITVLPHTPGSASLDDIPEPDLRDGSVLVEAIAVGVCGTDVEIVEGKYGWAPPGKARLVLGHESLGHVIDPGSASAFREGDLVVGIVRRPDPRCRARTARLVNGTCAATASTPSAASRKSTASCRSAGASARVRDEGRPVARPAWRAARTYDRCHEGLGTDPRDQPACPSGRGARCWSPAPDQSGC